jgi:hypothetical protein
MSKKPRSQRKIPQRPERPALGRGRVQIGARRAFVCGEIISTADAAQFAYCRKTLLHGRQLEPHDYRLVRRALELIAVPIGRGGGRGRPMRWRLSVAVR